ncbi:MAG: hypothetical protein EBR82_62195 [Caulobacteraceae bacterium]|nr:hypothetical protein [Caulobacteraceae bacterium]
MSRWLSLGLVERAVPLAALRGVSEVARSPRGFLPIYRAAGGKPSRVPLAWRRRRAAFISRHVAQAKARGESWFQRDGRPTRRHLALIMWAYSPTPARVR